MAAMATVDDQQHLLYISRLDDGDLAVRCAHQACRYETPVDPAYVADVADVFEAAAADHDRPAPPEPADAADDGELDPEAQ